MCVHQCLIEGKGTPDKDVHSLAGSLTLGTQGKLEVLRTLMRRMPGDMTTTATAMLAS